MKALLAAGAAAAIAFSSPALSAELITNGSFETGNFDGWQLSNVGGGTAPVVIHYNQAGNYPTGAFGEAIPTPAGGGNFAAYFSSDTANPDTLKQSVNVVEGQTYALSFDYYVPQNGYNNPYDATALLPDRRQPGGRGPPGRQPQRHAGAELEELLDALHRQHDRRGRPGLPVPWSRRHRRRLRGRQDLDGRGPRAGDLGDDAAGHGHRGQQHAPRRKVNVAFA